MATSFSELKKKRNKSFDKLNDQLTKMTAPKGGNADDRFWKLTVDKAGNGYAVIRFLPEPVGEDDLFVRKWDHGFQGPGGWYIEDSRTTLGEPDPLSEYNSNLWNEDGGEKAKEQARKQKRRLSFYANIYVVKDPANPENEGKVFLFKFGKKIFDILNDAMNPQFDDEVAMNPFDLWEGADFKLKARQVEGYRNYDKSEFASQGVISGPDGNELSEEEQEEVWNSTHSLQDIIDPKNFKSYDELKARLYKVLALDGGSHASNKTAEDDDEGTEDFKPDYSEQKEPKMEEESSPFENSGKDDEDEDTLDFFANLADD